MEYNPDTFLPEYEEVLVPKEVGNVIRKGEKKVLYMLRTGEIRSIRDGRRYIIPTYYLWEYLYGSSPQKKG